MILVNGMPSDHIQVLDRGLMYGDGVFRTMLIRAGRALGWNRHYAKLQADCSALKLVCPAIEVLSQELGSLVNAKSDCVAKIIVTRGVSARGYAVNMGTQPTHIVMTSPLPSYSPRYEDEGVSLHVCNLRLSHQPQLAGIKHLNRLENVMARMEWNDPEIAEGLLLDMDGNVVEATMSNLFMLKDGVLYTPELKSCGVAGVTRDRIMTLAPGLGLKLVVGNYSLDELLEAEEVILCNSVIGAWQVKACESREWGPGWLSNKLRNLLSDEEV